MVGELYGRYTPLKELCKDQKQFLAQHGIEIERNEVHDAAGINDDYPGGRGVFFEDHNRFVILVNFEEHICIKMLENKLAPNLKQLRKLVKAFDRVGFATDAYLGYLTTAPQMLGTGLLVSGKVSSGDRSEQEIALISQA